MQVLQCFAISQDDYTLLRECAKGKPENNCPLHERTLLCALRDRGLLRCSRHTHAWELTDYGYAALEEIQSRVPPARTSAGPAKIFHMKR